MSPPHSRKLYSILTAAVLAVGVVAVYIDLISTKDLVLAMLPLVTTFLGATLAFRLTEDKEREKEQHRRRHALDFALFVLMRQHNAVRQCLSPFQEAKSPFERAFNVPANKPPDYQGLKQALSELSFLLDTGHPQLLFELAIEQERFEQAIEALRIRNEFYVDELQPALERVEMIARRVTLEDAERLLGSRIFGASMNQAQFVLEHFEASSESLPNMVKSLRGAAKQLFPNASFVMYAGAA
jgi:hypothetical protein